MTFEEAKEIIDDAWMCSDGDWLKFIVFLKDHEHSKCKEEDEPIKDEPIDRTRLNDSAKQFNDALLDEQAKMIKELKEQNEEQNDIIASRNTEIWELQEKVKKMGKQIAHLNEVIGKRNATIKDMKIDLDEKSDLLDDYRFSDKNKDEMISGLKKMNEGLRHQLAAATVNKVNEQALKSAESALVYKDKVIDRLKKTISDAVDILEKKDDRVYNIDPESITDDWYTKAALSFFHITK